jgi:hypothetical protein
MSCDERVRSFSQIQYARGIATGAGGERKSSSMFCRTVESESIDKTLSYWVWLKTSSFVKESAHVAVSSLGKLQL